MLILWGFIVEEETFLISYHLYLSTLFSDFAKTNGSSEEFFLP